MRTVAHVNPTIIAVTQASRVARAPAASTVGEKHQSAWATSPLAGPQRRAVRQSTSPARTVTATVVRRAASSTRSSLERPPYQRTCSSAAFSVGGVSSRERSAARMARANAHFGIAGARLTLKSRCAQRMPAAGR